MEQLVARINELARKHKSVGLTAEEAAEREQLRKQYLQVFKSNFKKQLDNIKYVEDEESETKLTH